MIIGHEGLPGSGKSYEFVVEHLIPAVKKGRKVYAYVEGLNHEKIAEICEITVDECKALVFELTADQVPDIYNHVEQNSMIGIDEIQNFFPNHKSKLDEKMTKFIAEHRHFGVDIVVMSQNLKDCHSIWRRRIERKLVFYKLSALGKDKKYKWTAFQAIPQPDKDPKYVESGSGFRNYEQKFYGSYKSHTSEDVNTEHYKDGRFNIWNKKSLRYGIPAAVILGAVACWYIADYFSNPTDHFVHIKEKPKPVASAPVSGRVQSAQPASGPQAQPVAQVVDSANPINFRPRYMGHPESAPAYDNMRQIKSMPTVYACIADADRCQCYTDQATRVDMVASECRKRLQNTVYNPYKSTNGAGVGSTYYASQVPPDTSGNKS